MRSARSLGNSAAASASSLQALLGARPSPSLASVAPFLILGCEEGVVGGGGYAGLGGAQRGHVPQRLSAMVHTGRSWSPMALDCDMYSALPSRAVGEPSGVDRWSTALEVVHLWSGSRTIPHCTAGLAGHGFCESVPKLSLCCLYSGSRVFKGGASHRAPQNCGGGSGKGPQLL